MVTANETNQPSPPVTNSIIPLNFPIATKLNHNNYRTWKSQVQLIIHGFNLTRFLEEPPLAKTLPSTDGQTITNPAFHSWHCQDQMLLGWIRSSLTETIQGQVATCQTTVDLWSRLKHSYSATSNARLTDLCRQTNSSLKGSGSCIDYLNRSRGLSDELFIYWFSHE
jgi:hypothetical protein